mmetsp:Transcript_59781/g.82127  ORF Transcript_59781/g.82127 Transcript_59781/m.82127 type:complete len:95 (+) Transcript_59781:3732-4016(+)
MKKGLGSAAKSFGSAITGVVTNPYEGAKSGGFKGFLKGTGKGLAGLVTKPITGVVDVVTKTSEGFSNAHDGRPEEEIGFRVRKPRAFYQREQFI